MNKTLATVSIVTYNSKHIFTVLDNLRKEFENDERFRFVIFDNNSSLDYQKKLKSYEDLVILYFNDENKGFGYGHNSNFKKFAEDSEYFLVFNPDILVEKNSLLKMIHLMDQEKDIGLCFPKVLNGDGTKQYLIRNRLTVFDFALRFIPFSFVKKMFHKRLATYECQDLSDKHNSDVKIGSGCFMLLRSTVFEEAKGFDERYFMYFEDSDLSLTIGKLGARLVYTPFSTVIHFYEKGAHKNKQLFKIFMQSMRKFFNKWGWNII